VKDAPMVGEEYGDTLGTRSRPDYPKSSGYRAGGVVLLGSAASMAVQFTSVVVLSRLLLPADFGLVAMVTVFIVLGNLLRDFGLPMAGLEARALTDQQASNLFWMNTGLAAAAAVALVLATPLLVVVYGEQRLGPVVPVMACIVFLNGAASQMQMQLARAMRYGALVVSDVAASVVGLGVAILLACRGWNYWALVFQGVIGAVVSLLIRWSVCRWKPLQFRRGHGSSIMFRSGAKYGVAHILTFLQGNVDSLIIGSQFGSSALGFYNRGYQLLAAPAVRVLDPLTQVVVPILNRARSAGKNYEPILLHVQFAVGLAVVWVFATTGGSADRLIPLILGTSWQETIEIFQVLAIGGSVAAFSHVSYWAFIHNQQSGQLLRYNLVSKPLVVGCLLAGSRYGIDGVAWGYSIGMAISWPINLYWLSRTAKLHAWAFARNGLLVISAGVVSAFATWATLERCQALPDLAALGAAGAAGTAVLFLFLASFPSTRSQLHHWRRALLAGLRRGELPDM